MEKKKKRWDEKNRGQERGSSMIRECEPVEKKQGGSVTRR